MNIKQDNRRKITPSMADKIREYMELGVKYRSIATMFGLNESTLYRFRQREGL